MISQLLKAAGWKTGACTALTAALAPARSPPASTLTHTHGCAQPSEHPIQGADGG